MLLLLILIIMPLMLILWLLLFLLLLHINKHLTNVSSDTKNKDEGAIKMGYY